MHYRYRTLRKLVDCRYNWCRRASLVMADSISNKFGLRIRLGRVVRRLRGLWDGRGREAPGRR